MTSARSWVVGLSASVTLHALAAVTLLLLASRAVTPPVSKPSTPPLQVLRVGVLSRGAAAPAPGVEVTPVEAPPVQRPIVMKHFPRPRPAGKTELAGGDELPLGPALSPGGELPAAPSGDVVEEASSAGAPSDWAARAFGVSNAALQGETAAAIGASGAGRARSGQGTAVTGDDVPKATGAIDAPPADVVSLMHARLAALAERCYPQMAQRFRQQGVVELLFSVDGAGALTQQTVGRSSGVASLDRAAMECVVPQAAPFPAATRGYRFRVPVRFGQATR